MALTKEILKLFAITVLAWGVAALAGIGLSGPASPVNILGAVYAALLFEWLPGSLIIVAANGIASGASTASLRAALTTLLLLPALVFLAADSTGPLFIQLLVIACYAAVARPTRAKRAQAVADEA
jgi:hypothetical protein